jgi:hypothetical protein
MIDNKIKPIHTQRSAFVDIRQSTPTQVEHHRESTARQYALVQRARERGWPKEQVIVVDEDLGVSGASVVNRGGFTRMASEVALGGLGLSSDWRFPGSRTLTFTVRNMAARIAEVGDLWSGILKPGRSLKRPPLKLKRA